MNQSVYCKGCLVPGANGKGECYASNFNEDEDCPCTVCLVKTMCSSSCDLFDEFSIRIVREEYGTE